VPVEREIQRQSTVQFHGGQSRPIGAIDFSTSATGSRRFGPWERETHGHETTGGIIIHDDGSVASGEQETRYHRTPDAGRTCTTHDNVTVCR